ncbi:MAG: GT4 family glycosyltransferase PelF, partial [Selenomonadaceae bacterium]
HIEPSKPPVDRPMCIGAVVRVVPIKDIVTLLRAFFLVKQAIPDIQLKIMGQYDEDPEYYEICRQTVETLQLADVEFTGSVDVAQYYGKMDLLVLSSISEGQPLAILEGLASRRPFVATDVGCCREVLYGTGTDEFGPAGAIVPAMDYEAMAGEIIKLAGDFSRRYRLAENGWQRIASLYTYERFITAYREIYAEEAGRE